MTKIRFQDLLFIQFLMLCLAVAGVFGKLISTAVFPSWRFFIYFFSLNALHMTYAVFWQQLLKKLPLSQAYMNKAIGIVWGLILGYLVFDEKITGFMLLGSALIVYGLILVVMPNE